jgi:hypothetical protein
LLLHALFILFKPFNRQGCQANYVQGEQRASLVDAHWLGIQVAKPSEE